MNRHIAAQLRAIVLTDTHLFRLNPDEGFKNTKEAIQLREITSITITEEPEYQLIVLSTQNSPATDIVFYLQSKDPSVDRVPELIANIYRACSR
jgi:hypothetical protein